MHEEVTLFITLKMNESQDEHDVFS